MSETTGVVRSHLWIAGRVQGVWFRESCRRQAAALGIAGWVRNQPGGQVEAVFEGPTLAVSSMIEWCKSGPPGAEVTEIEVIDEAPDGETGFTVR